MIVYALLVMALIALVVLLAYATRNKAPLADDAGLDILGD